MPRRNFWFLATLTVVCLACSMRARRSAQIVSYAMDLVEHYFLEPVDDRKLLEGALDGMMGELKDQHSVYLHPKGAEELQRTLDQEFGGVGLQLTVDPATNQLTVVSPLFGAPAFEAGIRPRDRILRIAGRSTRGLSLEDAADLMKGSPGSAVDLSVQHEGETQPVDIRIVRAIVHVDSVHGDTRNPDGSWNYFLEGCDRIGYVRISIFAKLTAEEIDRILRRLVAEGMRGLVLDLRDNPGGMLEAAIDVCKMFLPPGPIVSTRDRDGNVKGAAEALDSGAFLDFPIAVLVNGQSASASEIVAACLQDRGRAIVVGQRTYGKGTVQEVLDLPGREGKLKITSASFWRPSGKNINRPAKATESEEWGVTPDAGCEVKLSPDDLTRVIRARYERTAAPKPPAAKSPPPQTPTQIDPQLAKAVQCLEKAIKKTP
jgi:carboxyl-terminal processing protease